MYRLIVETMMEAAFTLASDGSIRFANARFPEFVGRPMAQIVGRPLQEFITKESFAAVESLLIVSPKQPITRRLVFRAADGTTVPAHISANVIHRPDGVTICVVAST